MNRRDILKGGTVVAALTGAPALSAQHRIVSREAKPGVPPRLSGTGQLKPKEPLPIADDADEGTQITPMTIADRQKHNAVPERGTCSIRPGVAFRDTLISGTGHMLFELTGDPYSERVRFHHERLMLPWRRPFEAPIVADALPEIRRLLLAGKYREGADYAFRAMTDAGLPVNTKRHPTIAAFDMRLGMPATGRVDDYLRTVDFTTGEMRVGWRDRRGRWLRRSFASRIDNVCVQRLDAPGGNSLATTIAIDAPTVGRHEGPVTFGSTADSENIVFTGRFDPSISDEGYVGVTRILRDGGVSRIDGGRVVIEGARSVTLITRIEWYESFDADKIEHLSAAVAAIEGDYDALLARDRQRQHAFMDRVRLDLGGGDQRWMSGEELLDDQRTRDDYNPALLERIFDMGRYWLLASSGTFPVQPMAGEVNININLQVAPGTIGDVPEAMGAFHDWVESLLPDCRNNARNIFGMRGAVYPVLPDKDIGVSFHYARTEGAGVWPHPYWISAGGWLYSPFWDHYLATGDTEFLRNRIIPGLKELALFYEDFLTVRDDRGNVVFVPSFSPENWPEDAEPLPSPVWPLTQYDAYHMAPPAPFVINSAMDVMVCRQVLTHLIEACETLNIEAAGVARWKALLAGMPPYRTTDDGTLKEWGWPGLMENYDQRHVSHLYGAWPSDEIDPDTTPDLARAALLADRKRGPANTSAHGLCHRALAGARLKDRYLVDFELKQLLNQGYFNQTLRSSHNPYGSPMPDAQGGVPAILMEMLCHTRPGRVELLSALPSDLRSGSLDGMRGRCFARIDRLAWNLDERRVELTITSLRDQTLDFVARYGIAHVAVTGAALTVPAAAAGQSCAIRFSRGRAATIGVTLASDTPARWARPQAS